MPFQMTMLWSDLLVYIMVLCLIIFIVWVIKHRDVALLWRKVLCSRAGMVATVILSVYALVAVLDSIHYHPKLPNLYQGEAFYSSEVKSVLDLIFSPLDEAIEQSYSAPLARYGFTKTSNAEQISGPRYYPRLVYGGRDIQSQRNYVQDITLRILLATGIAIIFFVIMVSCISFFMAKHQKLRWSIVLKNLIKGQSEIAWREAFITLGLIIWFICISVVISQQYHFFGTDKVGTDVFYLAIKSIRTGLIIGTLTSLFMLPFAIIFGTMAGYYGGRTDDIIQFVYTTISSIPGVLLVSAAILSLQVFISNHREYFANLALWADARLIILCAILGLTSWTNLCRLLRGESLKLRETDYVQAAVAMGAKSYKIISRHILPNVFHVILITLVLDFSGLVLAEAVLSYVGVGVDPSTISWGNMINSARLELAREPMVWWPLLAAFVFMFVLVLSANLFADAVRDAFDPRLKHANTLATN